MCENYIQTFHPDNDATDDPDFRPDNDATDDPPKLRFFLMLFEFNDAVMEGVGPLQACFTTVKDLGALQVCLCCLSTSGKDCCIVHRVWGIPTKVESLL